MQTRSVGSITIEPGTDRAAGAGVEPFGMAFMAQALGLQGLRDVFAATAAGVNMATGDQGVQRHLVTGCTARLVDRGIVKPQAKGLKLNQYVLTHTGRTAGNVHIFNPYQPAPRVGACVKPASQGGNQ